MEEDGGSLGWGWECGWVEAIVTVESKGNKRMRISGFLPG